MAGVPLRRQVVEAAADKASEFLAVEKISTSPVAGVMATARHYSTGQCYTIDTEMRLLLRFGLAIQWRAPFGHGPFVGLPCGSGVAEVTNLSKQYHCS
jgi:hypothetical protein